MGPGKGRLSTAAKAPAHSRPARNVAEKLNAGQTVRALKDILRSLTLSLGVENFLQVFCVGQTSK